MNKTIKAIFLLLPFLLMQNAFAQVWSGGPNNTDYGWRLGTASIGMNAGAWATLHLYNGTANTHLALSGPGPGIKFNEGGTSAWGADRAGMGFVTTAGLYVPTSAVNDFVFRNNTDNGNILFSTTSGLVEKMRITSAGYVGIGTTSPTSLLHVNSTTSGAGNDYRLANFVASSGVALRIGVGYSNAAASNPANMEINALNNNLILQGDAIAGLTGVGQFPLTSSISYSTPSSKLHLQGGNFQITNSPTPPDITTSSKYGLTMGFNGGKTKAATDYSWVQSSNGPLVLNPLSNNTLTTQTNNYVAIGFNPTAADGISTAPGYNLVVKGKILCEELKIKLKPSTATQWPDYVFAPNYKLLSVDSLQSYINTNCHLPDIPSAAEVEENGIMAGEMNSILLKKVEELTLYMIEQNKKTSNQETEIELLKKQNELLMQQVQLLVQNSKK